VSEEVLIFGVPQDIGIQRNGGRAGASEGPAAIRHFLFPMVRRWGSITTLLAL